MSGETTRGASAERHDVVVVGAGPTGLVLAGELALGGVDVAVVERRTERTVVGTRARGMHARTLEVFDQRGILERFLAEGTVAQTQGFAGIRLDIADFPSRHPHGLALWQCHTERLLEDWVLERGVPVRRGVSVVDFTEHAEDLEVALDDDSRIRARYVVGCDGGRSTLRKRAGIEFVGFDQVLGMCVRHLSSRLTWAAVGCSPRPAELCHGPVTLPAMAARLELSEEEFRGLPQPAGSRGRWLILLSFSSPGPVN